MEDLDYSPAHDDIDNMVIDIGDDVELDESIKEAKHKKQLALNTGTQITYKLIFPVEVGGRTIDTVILKRAKMKDIQIANQQGKKDPERVLRHLLCSLGGLTPAELDEFDLSDMMRLSRAARNFWNAGGIPANLK